MPRRIFRKAAQFSRSHRGQSQSPDNTQDMESQTEMQHNTAKQPTSATQAKLRSFIQLFSCCFGGSLESDSSQGELDDEHYLEPRGLEQLGETQNMEDQPSSATEGNASELSVLESDPTQADLDDHHPLEPRGSEQLGETQNMADQPSSATEGNGSELSVLESDATQAELDDHHPLEPRGSEQLGETQNMEDQPTSATEGNVSELSVLESHPPQAELDDHHPLEPRGSEQLGEIQNMAEKPTSATEGNASETQELSRSTSLASRTVKIQKREEAQRLGTKEKKETVGKDRKKKESRKPENNHEVCRSQRGKSQAAYSMQDLGKVLMKSEQQRANQLTSATERNACEIQELSRSTSSLTDEIQKRKEGKRKKKQRRREEENPDLRLVPRCYRGDITIYSFLTETEAP